MALEIFQRKEQKYLITIEQYEKLLSEMGSKMRNDKNGQEGRYTVTSLYFDNSEKTIYYETKNKLKYRQKLRLRVYDDATGDSTAFFEVKQKHNKIVNKRRLLTPLSEAYRYLNNEAGSDLENYQTSNTQVLKEIDYFRNLYNLQPEMIVSYKRHALHGADDENIRLTFDFDLKCRKDDLLLEHGAYGENFIDSNLVVLEVKVEHSVPLWMTRLLQNLQCEQRSASKFCTSTELLTEQSLAPTILNEQLLKETTSIGGTENGTDQQLIYI